MKQAIRDFFRRYELAWEILMIFLALGYGAISFVPDWVELSSGQAQALDRIDTGITVLFVLEFAVRFWSAVSRSGYVKQHWVDLIAIVPLARWIRIARIGRVFRLLRLARLTRAMDSLDDLGINFARFARLNGMHWMLLSLTGTMVLGAVVWFVSESPVNPAMHSFWDAFYAAVITWAGTGYGDITPVTTTGRVCGIALIVSGVMSWGLVIGNLSAFFSERSVEKFAEERRPPYIEHLKSRISNLDSLSEEELVGLQGEIKAIIEHRLKKLNQ